MKTYTPNGWALMKSGIFIRLFASWDGDFTTGGNWRLSSDVEAVKEDNEYYYFYTHSGSCYTCSKNSNRISVHNSLIFARLVYREGEDAYVVNEDKMHELFYITGDNK